MTEVNISINLTKDIQISQLHNNINVNPLGTLNLKRLKMANGELIATYGKVVKESPVDFALAAVWTLDKDAQFDTDHLAEVLKSSLPVCDVNIAHDISISEDKSVSMQINVYGFNGEDNAVLFEKLDDVLLKFINNNPKIKIG